MQNKIKYYQVLKKLLIGFVNSLAIIAKQEIRINYIEKISIKTDAEKIKHYQISKKLLEDFGQFFWHHHKTTNYN